LNEVVTFLQPEVGDGAGGSKGLRSRPSGVNDLMLNSVRLYIFGLYPRADAIAAVRLDANLLGHPRHAPGVRDFSVQQHPVGSRRRIRGLSGFAKVLNAQRSLAGVRDGGIDKGLLSRLILQW
jgi:hypothetical protein